MYRRDVHQSLRERINIANLAVTISEWNSNETGQKTQGHI